MVVCFGFEQQEIHYGIMEHKIFILNIKIAYVNFSFSFVINYIS